MKGPLNAQSFIDRGFTVLDESPHSIKVEKGCCEILISVVNDKIVLELPVIKLWGKRANSFVLTEYLLRRNGDMKGPGFFGIKDDCVYYLSAASDLESSYDAASKMSETIARLGSKIINVSAQ